jgi:dTDP-4-dehydrorhamnose reductase
MEMITKELSGLYNLGGPQKVSLYEIGHWILRGKNYNQKYLKGILRAEEKNGPPRMGDVSMNSSKAQKKLSFQLVNPLISIISK